jgi:hypothetical protein
LGGGGGHRWCGVAPFVVVVTGVHAASLSAGARLRKREKVSCHAESAGRDVVGGSRVAEARAARKNPRLMPAASRKRELSTSRN